MRSFTLLFALAALASAQTDVELIHRMGDEAWAVREEAMLACLERPGMRQILEEAARGDDAEIRWRAKWVLGCFEWGLDPETAKESGNPFDQFDCMTVEDLVECVTRVREIQRPARAGLLLGVLVRKKDEEILRDAVIEALRLRGEGFTEWALARLKSEVEEERVGAALVLALWGDASGLHLLKKELEPAREARFGWDATRRAVLNLGDAGVSVVLDAVKARLEAKKAPSVEDIQMLSEATAGREAVEETLLRVLSIDWGAGELSPEAEAAVVKGLAVVGGEKSQAALLSYWEKDPGRRLEALSAVAGLASPERQAELAAQVMKALPEGKATSDELFVAAALFRMAGRKKEHREVVDQMAALAPPSDWVRVAEVAVTYLEAEEPQKAIDYLVKAAAAGADTSVAKLLKDEAARALAQNGELQLERSFNNDAWKLVTEPGRMSHPGLAVRLCEHTVKFTGDSWAEKGTLGAAYYRAGRLEDAVRQLEPNVEAPYDGKQEDIAFLVMAYKKLGRSDDANRLNQKILEWEKNDRQPNPMRPELERVLRQPDPAK